MIKRKLVLYCHCLLIGLLALLTLALSSTWYNNSRLWMPYAPTQKDDISVEVNTMMNSLAIVIGYNVMAVFALGAVLWLWMKMRKREVGQRVFWFYYALLASGSILLLGFHNLTFMSSFNVPEIYSDEPVSQEEIDFITIFANPVCIIGFSLLLFSVLIWMILIITSKKEIITA